MSLLLQIEGLNVLLRWYVLLVGQYCKSVIMFINFCYFNKNDKITRIFCGGKKRQETKIHRNENYAMIFEVYKKKSLKSYVKNT